MIPLPLSLDDIQPAGRLLERALRNFERLERDDHYRIDEVWESFSAEWPGDSVGRVGLAYVLLARATGREPRQLGPLLDALPAHRNEKGYLGRVLPEGTLDEQQLSGHSWFLRALCEHYEWKADPVSAEAIHDVIQGLLLPARGVYARYPARPENRVFEGEAAGNLVQGKVGDWYSSTDIGCAFILLDGATHAYRLFPSEALREQIEEMIAAYEALDFVGISCQTHGTLSSLRGVLRFYEDTGRPASLLATARRVWDLYLREGMSENYGNYNWFGRPHWTEPCGIVDSFMVATDLWRFTGEAAFLDQAHCILHNGLAYAQRPNGGFGCDTCVGAEDEFLSPTGEGLEAWWCCSMRGGEGLARAAQVGWFTDGEDIVLPFYADATARFQFETGEVVIEQTTGYPHRGDVRLRVLESSAPSPRIVRFFLPKWAPTDSVQVRMDGAKVDHTVAAGFVPAQCPMAPGSRIHLTFDVPLHTADTHNIHSIPGRHTFRHGALILGIQSTRSDGTDAVALPRDADLEPLGEGRYRVAQTGQTLGPLGDMFDLTDETALQDRRQILFADKTS